VAENVGNAGDSELMGLNATSRVIVSVPADTKIYLVFTKHQESQAGLLLHSESQLRASSRRFYRTSCEKTVGIFHTGSHGRKQDWP